jgi:predicted Zn-dependent protease
MNKLYIILTILLALSFLGCSKSEVKCSSLSDSIVWRELPIKIHVGSKSNLDNQNYNSLVLSINEWNKAMNYEMFQLTEEQPYSTGYGQGMVIVTQNARGVASNSQGDTEEYYVGHVAYQVNVVLHMDVLGDKESILIHELGHVLGLQHTEINDKVYTMNKYLPIRFIRRYVDQDSINKVRCLYKEIH